MPVSKHRKGHAKKALQRKTEVKQQQNAMRKFYANMYDQLRNKVTSMPDMLNQEEQMKLPGGPEQTATGYPEYKVIEAPVADPNEPVTIASQWPADMQLPEIEQTITTSTND